VDVVRAAGGLVLRDGEVLLVHRPRYDDWSFPKGKLLPGESGEAAALREVEEETGFVCRLDDELATSEYVDGRGRPKVVRYWLMTSLSGEFVPHAEVDEVRWLPLDEAEPALTYERDREVLRRLRARSS
jgi:8-oxo-dGTP pyrophosphatase MutT (NUDIX family)